MRSFNFGRLLKGDKQVGFNYDTSAGTDADWSQRVTSMQSVGTHWQVTIRNYTKEDILLVSSLRTDPVRVPSIIQNDRYRMAETTNHVVIELRMRDVTSGKNGETKVVSSKKIEIRCPAHYLQNNSLFIEELGTYVTIEGRYQATRECIAQDVRYPTAVEVSVPEASVKTDPVSTLSDYEPLVRNCLERADKIRVRVGVRVDVDPSRVPEYIRSMRIAVLDHDFSPYHNNRMFYDPTVDPDDFAIENHHWDYSEPLWGRFSDLARQAGRAYYVDTEEHRSFGGVLSGLVIFADESALYDYLFAHRADEMYEELLKRLMDKNGSHALTKRISELEQLLEKRDDTIEELRDHNRFEKEQVKEYKRIATAHEDTIKKLKSHHEEAFGFDAIRAELDNERESLRLGREKLEAENRELISKQAQASMAHRASIWKSTAEILKSGWGALLAMITIGTAAYNMYNKLNSKAV